MSTFMQRLFLHRTGIIMFLQYPALSGTGDGSSRRSAFAECWFGARSFANQTMWCRVRRAWRVLQTCGLRGKTDATDTTEISKPRESKCPCIILTTEDGAQKKTKTVSNGSGSSTYRNRTGMKVRVARVDILTSCCCCTTQTEHAYSKHDVQQKKTQRTEKLVFDMTSFQLKHNQDVDQLLNGQVSRVQDINLLFSG